WYDCSSRRSWSVTTGSSSDMPFLSQPHRPTVLAPHRVAALLAQSRAIVIFCVQGAVRPVLANLFLHYAFDRWMARSFPSILFERYADDIICHCRSEEEARRLWNALEVRFRACRLVLHPTKTKLVYCKDTNRR